ncbi:MAG: hypothetical protein ACKOBW_07605 [Planctomycetota bacterium]
MVDYVERWAERAELPAKRLLGWLELSTSKFHQWKDSKTAPPPKQLPDDPTTTTKTYGLSGE